MRRILILIPLVVSLVGCSFIIDPEVLKASDPADVLEPDPADTNSTLDIGLPHDAKVIPDAESPDMGCAVDEHNGGSGCVPLGTCSPGYHDGGEGVCLPEGECTEGFQQAYANNDGDEFGGGNPLPDCVSEAPPGQSFDGSDCDDSDAEKWRTLLVYIDADQDQYTVPVTVCAGDTLLPTWREVAHNPPRLGLRPGHIDASSVNLGNWSHLLNLHLRDDDGARCMPENANEVWSCQFLAVQDFNLQIPEEAQILGLRIIARAQSPGQPAPAMLIIRLESEGDLIGEAREASIEDAWADLNHGGPRDTWATELTPAQLNSPRFGVQLATRAESDTPIQVDVVQIEVFLDLDEPDCDDTRPSIWSRIETYTDIDRDGWGSGFGHSQCLGPALPEGESTLSNDCYDDNSTAHPYSQGASSTDRGDGSFDYNCDGEEVPLDVTSDVSCEMSGGNCLGRGMSLPSVAVAPCGENNEIQICGMSDDGGCALTLGAAATRCR